jgi:hypothetical protein
VKQPAPGVCARCRRDETILDLTEGKEGLFWRNGLLSHTSTCGGWVPIDTFRVSAPTVMNPCTRPFHIVKIYFLILKLCALSSLFFCRPSEEFAFAPSHHVDSLSYSACKCFFPLYPYIFFDSDFLRSHSIVALNLGSSRRDSSPCSVAAPIMPILPHANCSFSCVNECSSFSGPPPLSDHLLLPLPPLVVLSLSGPHTLIWSFC